MAPSTPAMQTRPGCSLMLVIFIGGISVGAIFLPLAAKSISFASLQSADIDSASWLGDQLVALNLSTAPSSISKMFDFTWPVTSLIANERQIGSGPVGPAGVVDEDVLYEYAVKETVSSLQFASQIDDVGMFRSKLRERYFKRLHAPDTAWSKVNHSVTRLSAPTWYMDENKTCNALGHTCSCLQRYLKHDKCSEVSFRQKPTLEVTVYSNVGPSLYLDCPSVACRVRFARTHANSSRALIRPVGYMRAGTVLIYIFPPKQDPEYNKNVLVTFESHERFGGQLRSAAFYKNLDVHITSEANVTKFPSWSFSAPGIGVSYSELPAPMYRELGLPFSERSPRISFFVSNCRQVAVWRTRTLREMSKNISLDSFGKTSCGWPLARSVSIQRDWPQCLRPKLSTQVRKCAEKECVLRNSRVTIVMENSLEEFYVTEKIYQALAAGAVPVYKGAPNIRDLLPSKDAAIFIDDFKDLASLAAYMKQVNSNETLYLKHTAWKRQPFSQGFLHMLRTTYSTCTVCEHYARDAVPALPLPNVSGVLPPCILQRFAGAGQGTEVPVIKLQSVAGVDAIFVVGGSDEWQRAVRQAVRSAWDANVFVVGELAGRGGDEERQCLSKADALCKLFGGLPAHSAACMEQLFAAYLCVVHGLQNALVVRGSLSLSATVLDVHSWRQILRKIPAHYEVADLGLCEGGTAAANAQVCSGVYMMSQQGARNVLRSEVAKVVTGLGGAIAAAANV